MKVCPLKKILDWAREHQGGAAMIGLPLTVKEQEKLPRAYIANVIYTIIGDNFKAWTDSKI